MEWTPDQPMWTRTAWQMGIPKVSIRQGDPSERGLHSLGSPPQALDWARTMEYQRKVPQAGENCPMRKRTQKRRRSVFGSLNHGADAEGLAMAVHSLHMVVVVPATSDRGSIPFGRGFTLKDPQAAGGQCSGSGKVVLIDSPACESNFGRDVGSRFN